MRIDIHIDFKAISLHHILIDMDQQFPVRYVLQIILWELDVDVDRIDNIASLSHQYFLPQVQKYDFFGVVLEDEIALQDGLDIIYFVGLVQHQIFR